MHALEQTVHIIPLGHEFDRAVRVFDYTKVDRVYLLTSWKWDTDEGVMGAEQRSFTERVSDHLRNKGIDVIIVDTDTFDILDVTGKVAHIVRKEVDAGNRVSINMSAAGRLTSVASTIVGMMHGVRVYYLPADNYSRTEEERKQHGISICTRVRPEYLMDIPIPHLDKEKMAVLTGLYRAGRALNSRELRKILRESGCGDFRDLSEIENKDERRKEESRQLMRLNQGILRHLERDGYITVEKRGRKNKVRITDSGKFLALASGEIDCLKGYRWQP
ncbi:MAG: HFX_2341 family transcriptional regulator domain-containing protein [Methanoculleaceae archaeon]